MRNALGNHGRRLPRYRHQSTTTVDDAVGDEVDTPIITRSTAPGDSRKLRGIPAIGYGVSGAIPGTAPHLTKQA